MSDDSPVFLQRDMAAAERIRVKAVQRVQLANNHHARQLAAIERDYKKEMIRAGLGVLLEQKQPA